MNASTLVQKLWNYCNVLRDDGMSYGDYVEQLTYLLFLKMADERTKPPHNQHFTLKTNPMRVDDLMEFVNLYNAANRNDRTASWSPENPDGRWRSYDYAELAARDKASLDIFWLKDEALADSDNLPAPDVIAQEIVDDLEVALEQFREVLADLRPDNA
jgi:hypothetical protein